ncbi:von Willebrand factor [Synchiropus picturatus]
MKAFLKISLWLPCFLLHHTVCSAGLTGRCSLFGRHHVHTFDGVLYQFPGDCSYLLAGDCKHRSFTLMADFIDGKRTGVTLFLGDVFELRLSVNGLLTQGEKMLSLPYASHSVFAGRELGYYKLWSEEFGFSVSIDNGANIAMTMSKAHANLTCGLCGNFNYEPADEYTAQEGFLTEDSYDFANSWAAKGTGEVCRRVSTPSRSCNSSKETSTILSACSVLQTSSLFLQCAHLVSVDAFLLLCQEEACVCDQATGEDCYCPILLEFARTCQAHGVMLRNWMEESQCFPRCPIGMQYSECTRACSTQCHSLNIQEICKEECVDGCTCPVGKVLDGNRCVEVSQCSCVHMGRHFPPGASISQDCNTCVCRHGSWECTNEDCPGECMVVGQSHFKTFDNKFFTFTGQCQFLLSRDCTDQEFSIIIENVQCADDQDAVCTRSVTVSLPTLDNMTVRLKHGGVVSVNGMDIQTPMFHGQLHIQRSVQSSVHLKLRDSLQLNWDGRGRVLLKLEPKWAGKTCGLCGNYNGNQGDDFLTGSGLIESSPQTFGHAWRINGDCQSAVKPDTDPCSINPKRVRFAEEGCSAMMSEIFSPCHFLVNPSPFHRICRYDVCACEDGEECLCSALASYAAACAAKGVMLRWRSPSLCEMECPSGQVYEACGSICDRSCRSLSGAESGCQYERDVCEEGCFCPAGKYLSDSAECVTADRCTCLHDGQLYQPNDVYAERNSICYCENGAMRCSSTEMSSLMSDFFYDDDTAPARERRSASCYPPLVRADCGRGGSGLECARDCRNLDLPCVSQACIPGCLCPPGTVRHGEDCIQPDQCPCYLHNKPYVSGQSITVDCNTCVCEKRKWQCTNKLCDGVCRTVGEGHYITFDGLKYLFPGLCQYVLVQDMCNGEEGLFRVLLENEACGIVGHRCAKAITVYYHGGMIVMQHGEVKMKHPVPLTAKVEIIRSGQFYTVLLGKHISLSWDRGTNVVVHISASYRGRVCGLCGNFDGNINNDLVSSNNQLEVDSSHFGNSWKVNPSCADVTEIPAPCAEDIVKLVTVEQSCRLLTGPLFKACNSQVDPERYVGMCVEAACSCHSVGDCACFCDVIAAYAQACLEKSISITWRSNELCPMSCEELNPKLATTREELCQWRYNACGPACPITCQHPEPIRCSHTCVEGCHAYCPPGQLLDEVTMRCVDPSQCQVCVHEGQRISHDSRVILNHDDPNHCKICHCNNNTLSCEDCASITAITTPSPAFSTMPSFTTQMPEGTCDRAMDLAFLLDGSAALSEDGFQAAKKFILRVVDRFRMGSAHTRATVLLYHSGVKTDNLQVQKWLFKKIVRELHYAGGDAAFLDEAIKYLVYNIYDKNKRKHAGRIAIILTGSANPRPVNKMVMRIQKASVTTLTVALGPGVDIAQINEITKANPDNRAYVLSSTRELSDGLPEMIDYLCALGLEPIAPTLPAQRTPSTPQPPHVEPNVEHPSARAPTTPGFLPPTVNPSTPTEEITFIIEGSDSVGQENFNKTILFLVKVITQLADREKLTHITIIQYSMNITIEINQWELWKQKQLLREQLKKVPWRGGSETNTWSAISKVVKRPRQPTTPQLVFLVTENPPTDTVTRPPFTSKFTHVYPIGVGPRVRQTDLTPFSYPQSPLIIKDYSQLSTIVQQVINITHTTFQPLFPTLRPAVVPTLSNLPPSVSCKKPVDVIFLLRAGEPFEDMKTFVQSYIKSADIGPKGTHIGVIQYGDSNTAELSWKEEQSTSRLLDLVNRIPNRKAAASALGSALRFAVRTAISLVSGGRVGVAKVVVMLVTDKSADDVQEAANEALAAGVSVFPVGIGRNYDHNELRLLDPSGQNTLHLTSMDQLLMLLTLDRSYTEKICRAGPQGVCMDDHGNARQPGESWLLEDGCHLVLCHPSGEVTMQNHKISCDRLSLPTCRNHVPAVKVQEACSCRWECPCICMGSSTNHVVRFDSLALRLDVDSSCSYTLLSVNRGVSEGLEVKLHSGPCQDASNYNQVCMKAMEVTYGARKLLLKDDVTVFIGEEKLSLPWRHDGLELVCFGGVMLQLKIDDSYILSFTPQSNEFTITLHGSATARHSSGLCGACGEEAANVLTLRNGSPAANQLAFISDWTAAKDGGACAFRQGVECVSSVSMGCQALRSEIFKPCHAHIPVQSVLEKCEEQVCSESDVCELISAYAHLCRQSGVCVNWRSPHLCPLKCPSSMEYHACRTGCVEDCGTLQKLAGDRPVTRENETSCMTTPTEGCFCPEGKVVRQGECVSPEACGQCVDSRGRSYKYLQTWVPSENPCMICMCLDQERINCTGRPCDDVKAPKCGPCETLREKRGFKCCPEYECVCDPVKCARPEVPPCEDGQITLLKNPGECQPLRECVCKKELCSRLPPPACPAHRRLSVKKTKCCDIYECVCNCVNITRTCQLGFTTSLLTDDCGCTEIKCLPDKVCVVDGVVHPVGSEWEQGCEKCKCIQQQGLYASVYIARCSPPVCQRSCPLGSTYTPTKGECCGKCVPSSCVESSGDMLFGGKLRQVGEVWQSPRDKCVLNKCVRVNDEVLITASNVSCSALDTPSCPLGSELRCVTRDCCPLCYCAPLDVCVLNHTIIGAGEKMMIDACTHCECLVKNPVLKEYKLTCTILDCPTCQMGYALQKEEGACCGRCVPSSCYMRKPDGSLFTLKMNTTVEDGCTMYTCGVNSKGELSLKIKETSCPTFNRRKCLDDGGVIRQMGSTCCEMCEEPPCRRSLGTLNFVRVGDCQSERQIELYYCEGKCRSKSIYSLERAAVEQECVCCAATATEPLSVPILCANGTQTHLTVLSVTSCDCLSKQCT